MSRSLRRAAAATLSGLALTALPGVAHADPVTFVAWEGSSWRINDAGTNLLASFAAPAYDDSVAGWKTYTVQAAKVMGYGETYSQTPALSFGPDANNKYPVTYFRTAFDVADPSAISGLTLRHLRDDGAVFYLNGVEVLRSNMPAPPTTYGYISSLTEVSGSAELQEFTNVLPSSSLIAGRNVLSVAVFQQRAASSDLSLKVELSAEQAAVSVPQGGPAPVIFLAGGVGAAALLLGRSRRRNPAG